MILLDVHGFIICLLVAVAVNMAGFFVSAALKFEKIVDLVGSSTFSLLAVLSMALGAQQDPLGFTTRRIAVTLIVSVSRLELALFLFWRVATRGKDARFDLIRDNFWSFLGFWTFQIIWVYGVSLAVIFINTAQPPANNFTATEIAGATVACFGFTYGFIADIQKARFRAFPGHSGKACTTGLWEWSRHPNYFGEIAGWWGVFIMAVPVIQAANDNAGYVSLVSPLLTMLFLLCLSGLPTSEGVNQAKYMKTPATAEAYLAYRATTSIVLPMPPCVYASLPRCCKVCLFDLPAFEYRPENEPLTAGDKI